MEVNITIREGGLARPLPGEDHISALVVPSAVPLDTVRVTSLLQAKADSDLVVNNLSVQGLVSDYFTMNPRGELIICTVDADFAADVTAAAQRILKETRGDARILAWAGSMVPGKITAVQGVLNQMKAEQAPAVALVALDNGEYGTLADLPDSSTLNAPGVGVCIHELSPTIHGIQGAVMGALSKGAVNVSPAWVREYNYAQVVNGRSLKYTVADQPGVDNPTSNMAGYLYLRTYPGRAGYYLNDSRTATEATADLSTLEANTTLDKAVRGIYANIIPELGGPVPVNTDGTLRVDKRVYLETVASRALLDMQIDDEISAFELTIDEKVNVVQTSRMDIDFSIVPVGTLRTINASIGFVLSL